MGKLPAVLGLVLCLATVALPAAAKKKEKKSNPAAVALFEKALSVSDIEAKGSPAFRLQATVRIFGNQNKHADAVLVQFWAPGDKWREETMMPGYSLVKVSDGKRLWAKSALGYEPFLVYEAWTALGFPRRLRWQLNPKTDFWWQVLWQDLVMNGEAQRPLHQGPYLRAPEESGNLKCVKEVEVKYLANEFCLDAKSGDLVSEVDRDTGIRYEYSDYAPFGQKNFPRLVRVFYATKYEFLEVHVIRIDPLAQPSPELFLPMKDSQEELSTACGKARPPKMLKMVPPSYEPSSFGNQLHGRVVVYGNIGVNGTLQDLWPVRSPALSLTNSALAAVRKWRYKPAACESAGTARAMPMATFINVVFKMQQ